MAVLLLNISTVPWYGLATLQIIGRRAVACGCHTATCSGPLTATFMWPAGEQGLLNTGKHFSLPLKKLDLSYDRTLNYLSSCAVFLQDSLCPSPKRDPVRSGQGCTE